MTNQAAVPTPSPRERILTTAHDLFYREGIRATGIDRVIAEAGVTKVTFYRHFPSKNDLVRAFLERRHRNWMDWFTAALARHGGTAAALAPTLAEWFNDPVYRGCAFINTVGELAGDLPGVVEIARRHKEDMTTAIESLLSDSPGRLEHARALAVAVDGAIIQAQYNPDAAAAIAALKLIVHGLQCLAAPKAPAPMPG